MKVGLGGGQIRMRIDDRRELVYGPPQTLGGPNLKEQPEEASQKSQIVSESCLTGACVSFFGPLLKMLI